MSAASEMAEYTAAAFYSYEAVRDQRDEALCRIDELTDERDRLRGIAAALEQDCAAWRRIALAAEQHATYTWCDSLRDGVQCSLPTGHDPGCIFIGLLP